MLFHNTCATPPPYHFFLPIFSVTFFPVSLCPVLSHCTSSPSSIFLPLLWSTVLQPLVSSLWQGVVLTGAVGDTPASFRITAFMGHWSSSGGARSFSWSEFLSLIVVWESMFGPTALLVKQQFRLHPILSAGTEMFSQKCGGAHGDAGRAGPRCHSLLRNEYTSLEVLAHLFKMNDTRK